MQFYKKLVNPLSITLLYVVGGGLWILFSDQWAQGLSDDPAYVYRIQTYKGWFYILMTAFILYLLIVKHQKYVTESALQLREIQRQYEMIFLQNPYPMIIIALENQAVLGANKAVWSLLKTSPRKHDSALHLQDFFSKKLNDKLITKLQHLTEGANLGVFKANDSTGDDLILEISAFPIRFDDKNSSLVILHDVTSEVRNREKINELTRSLEHTVEERTRELQNANTELEAFSYSVSHDLRAPLRAIDGFSLAVIEEFGKNLDPMAINYLERVRKASARMATLIDDLTRLSRITRTSITLEEVDLTELVHGIVAENQSAWPDIHFEVEVQPDMKLLTDPGLMKIIMDNLISNAFKYSSDTQKPFIQIGVTESDGIREYFVRDNGAGFDIQYADKIFKAFQRLSPTSNKPGTGIGLATVERIISRLKGGIRVESEPGKGATFYFFVPQ